MSINQQPIFTRQGDLSSNNGVLITALMSPTILTATGDYTGVSANYKLVFTADPTYGSFLNRLRFKAIGTNTASVARIFINNGGLQTLVPNNTFYGEQDLPGTTAINTTSTVTLDYPMNLFLPPGFCIYVGVATTVAAGGDVTPIAGSY